MQSLLPNQNIIPQFNSTNCFTNIAKDDLNSLGSVNMNIKKEEIDKSHNIFTYLCMLVMKLKNSLTHQFNSYVRVSPKAKYLLP